MPLPAVIKNSPYLIPVWWIASAAVLAIIESRSVKFAMELWSAARAREVLATLVFFFLLQTLPAFSIVYDVLSHQYQTIVSRTDEQKEAIANSIAGNRKGIDQSNYLIDRAFDAYTSAEADTTPNAASRRNSLMKLMNRIVSQRSVQLATDTKMVGNYDKTLRDINSMTPQLEFVVEHVWSWPLAIAALFPLALLAMGFSLRDKSRQGGSISDILEAAESLPPNLQPTISNTITAAVNSAISSDYFKGRQHADFVDLITRAESDNGFIRETGDVLRQVDHSRLSPEVKETVKEEVKRNLFSKLPP